MRLLVYILLGVFSFLLQAVFFPHLMPYQYMPNLLLMWIVVITLMRGRYWGLWVAIIAGIVQDVVISNFFGLYLLPYILIAYSLHNWSHTIYEEQWYTTVGWGIGMSIVCVFLQALLLFVARESISIPLYMWYHIWPSALINGVLAFLLHKLTWNLEAKDEYIW